MTKGFESIDRQFRQPKAPAPVCARCQSVNGLELHNIAPDGEIENRLLLCAPCAEFHAQTTQPRWFWAACESPYLEDYESAPSREEAISAATEQAKNDESEAITICFSVPYIFKDEPFTDVGDILERWQDDNNPDVVDAFELSTTGEEERDLERMLNAAFTAWRLKHRIGFCDVPNDVTNEETITVGD